MRQARAFGTGTARTNLAHHLSTRSVDLIERTLLNGAVIPVMEASIIPESLRMLDGHPGFPPLPEVAMSVHTNRAACGPHVGTFADYLVGKLGRRR